MSECSLKGKAVWTIGHSIHSEAEFEKILIAHRIEALVDVRSFPGSRRYPHFNESELAQALEEIGIQYLHYPRLGGRRRQTLHSKNTNWKNASFRAYADHMETEEFKQGIEDLLKLSETKRTAIMCAEALWWRCHRSLIADYLKARGVAVIHLLKEKHTEAHPYTSAARIVEGRLSYEGLFAE